MKALQIIAGVFLFSLSAVAQAPAAAPAIGISSELGIAVKMRDGVTLRADIYRPADSARHPVILTRTPYNKAAEVLTCGRAATKGYVCIAMDVRGRYSSEGDWYTFLNESNDGYDSVEWAAALPYANGKVAMFGWSYVGATQWLAALSHPPHLVAIQPTFTASNYHEGWVYQGGALEQWFLESWTSGLAVDTLSRATQRRTKALEWSRTLPLRAYPVLSPPPVSELVPYYHDWISHPDYGEFWRRWAIDEHYSDLTVASFNIGGWYDIFLSGTLRNYVGMRAKATTPWARANTRLLIGPWFHGPINGKAGVIDFGASSIVDTTGAMLDWYDGLLQGKPAAGPEKPVRIFIMGINQWRDEDDWPLQRARNTKYYLSSNGHANTSAGDGSLAPTAAAGAASDSYIYDPANPVPTTGGNLCCDPALQSGAFDQREIEKREDVLVYTTAPLQHDLEVTGPLSIELYVSSSTVDTDFTAKLVDVHPDGFAQNLADGIQRMRYLNSPEKAQLIEPGKLYKVVVDMGATGNVFREGHRIRVEISSSNFPHFSRNLSTAESPETGSEYLKARNSIYHDAEHPSAIILPVIPQ